MRLVIPIALQNLLLSAVAVCDTMMLGQFEQNAMTAVSYAAQIQFIQNLLVGSTVGAGTPCERSPSIPRLWIGIMHEQ